MKLLFSILLLGMCGLSAFAQIVKIEPGVSQDLAILRAPHYSDVRYKLNLTLEKMSPVLKGTIEIRLFLKPKANPTDIDDEIKSIPPIILDWRKIVGHEKESSISNVSINGANLENPSAESPYTNPRYEEFGGHLIFRDDVWPGENSIKLDFTSPILSSGSAITRYIDKEDGSEYIYSILSPSNASTAFPMFNQPDLKASFQLNVYNPTLGWSVVSSMRRFMSDNLDVDLFPKTKPISPYLFAFAAGDFDLFVDGYPDSYSQTAPNKRSRDKFFIYFHANGNRIYVRKSQAAKLQPQATDVFKTARPSNKYFDYKSAWPKYDLVLIPELPSEMIQAAGVTFVRESSIIGDK